MCGVGTEFDLLMEDVSKTKQPILKCNKCNSTRVKLIDVSDFINNYVCVECNTFDDFRVENVNTTTELCTNCNEETPYSTDTHIDQRQHYIDGGGQLCVKCWNKIYDKANTP